MPTVGYGVGGGLGLGTEETYGTGVAPTAWIPFVSESIAAESPIVQSGTITGDRSVSNNLAGPRSGAGDFTVEVDGPNIGLPLYYANGNASGAVTSAAIPGRISSAPSQSVGSGGSLAVGTYRYRVASVWTRTLTAERFYLPVSAEVQATTASGNQTVTLGWTDPTTLTPPAGYTHAGTAVYRSAVGGGAGSEKFLAYVSGATATYADDGSVTIANGAASTLTGSLYQHTFVKAFTTGSNPLPGFSATVVKDNDVSERFLGCRMNSAEFTLGDGAAPVQAKFGLMARDFEEVANPVVAISNVPKMMAWQGALLIDGTHEETIEGFQITLANNCELLPGLSGLRRRRDVGYGMRTISGSLSRSFQDHSFWRKMRAATKFSATCHVSGAPISSTAGAIPLGGNVFAYPIPYGMSIEAFNCSIDKAGSNVSGPGRMVEQLPFRCELDSVSGTDLRIRLFNLTASYA